MEKREIHHLPKDTVLADRYVLQEVSGEGNFGITYTGWDKLLESRVAVKEFFPVSRVSRDVTTGDNNVFVFQKDNYDEILHKYLEEAKRLSKLNQVEGIVSIRDFFYANNTAYIIMEYIEGISVKEYVTKQGKMGESEIKKCILPILNALEKVHEIGIIHRDISPDNIILTPDNKIVLVDFGSARQVNLPDDKSLTVMVKRGYSSPELYRSRGEQGPWTDVYAICATIYFMLTGKVPDEAIDRILEDETPSLVGMKGIKASLSFKKAVMKGISLRQGERYKNIGELKQDLYKEGKKNYKAFLLPVSIFLVCILVVLIWSMGQQQKKAGIPKEPTATPVVTVKPTPKIYTMISCKNMTKNQVIKEFSKQKFLSFQWKTEYSIKVKKGRVIRQSIPKGTEYGEGEKLTLQITLSKGAEKVNVPKVEGKDYEDAEKLLENKKFKVKIVWQESEKATGIVLSQSIPAGESVIKGKTITLTVSKQVVQQPSTTEKPKEESFDGIIT